MQERNLERKQKMKYTILTCVASVFILVISALVICNIYTTKTILKNIISGREVVIERIIFNSKIATE